MKAVSCLQWKGGFEPSARGGRLRLGIGEFRLKLCCNHLRKERASDERPDDRLDIAPGEPAR